MKLRKIAILVVSLLANAPFANADTTIGQYNTQILLKTCGAGITCYATVLVDNNGNPIGTQTGAPWVVSDPNNAAFTGAVALTAGTPDSQARRSVVEVCTGAGNVSYTLSDASTIVVPVNVGYNQFPFAITQVNTSGTTATCSHYNMK